MIITIDAIDGNSGQGQAVFSRSGLTTVYQHKVFQQIPLSLHEQQEQLRLLKRKKDKTRRGLHQLTTVTQ